MNQCNTVHKIHMDFFCPNCLKCSSVWLLPMCSGTIIYAKEVTPQCSVILNTWKGWSAQAPLVRHSSDRASTQDKTSRASFWSSPAGSLIHWIDSSLLHLLLVPGPILLVSSRLTKLGSWNFWLHFPETGKSRNLSHSLWVMALFTSTWCAENNWAPGPIGGPHNSRNDVVISIFILASLEYTFFITVSGGNRSAYWT